MTGPAEDLVPGAEPTAPEPQRLKFLMRSGNFFTVDGVTGFDIWTNALGRITQMKLEQVDDPRIARVYVASVALDQIEAVVRLPKDSGRAERA